MLLVAHLDTVHSSPVKQICKTNNGEILMSPQGIGGDDRCGVYALNAAYEQSEAKPWLLFTCNEEVGCAGASTFCAKYRKGVLPKELDQLKLIIEIDRKGRNDAVYYDCGNKEFEDYITGKGFKTASGSFSDISYVAPELGVAAVNLSSGYYNAHTLHEYINRKHLENTIKKVVEIIAESISPDFPQYEYVESYYNLGCSLGRYSRWYDEEIILKKLPEDIREEYEALLDFYTVSELEDCRMEVGDIAIHQLFETEFGDTHRQPKEEPGGRTGYKYRRMAGMYRKGMTVADAAREWVREFDAIQQGMIKKLMEYDIDDWHELTKPRDTDRVYVYELPEETPDGKPYKGTLNTGEITDCYDNETYRVKMDDGNSILVKEDDFEVERDTWLPAWGTMWSFRERLDDDWLENGGVAEMSRCGFRIYESEEFGYFFGIDGAGYDFYAEHWIPLYRARGMHWHDDEAEKRRAG